MKRLKYFAVAAAFALAGCLNMPTPPVQVAPAYVSGLNYEQFDLQPALRRTRQSQPS